MVRVEEKYGKRATRQRQRMKNKGKAMVKSKERQGTDRFYREANKRRVREK